MLIRESRSPPAATASGQGNGRGREEWLGGRHDLNDAFMRCWAMIIPIIGVVTYFNSKLRNTATPRVSRATTALTVKVADAPRVLVAPRVEKMSS